MARPTEKRGFIYHKRTPDDIKARATAKGGDFDSIFKPGFKVYKVREGKNLIRVLPPSWEKPRHYAYPIFVNYGIGADEQSYLSLSKMLKQKDPLEEARREAEQEGEEELVKSLRTSKRMLVWLIDRNNEDEGPLLWAMPHSFDVDLASATMDEDTKEYFYIDDPKEGHDVRFFVEGTGITRKYPGAKIKVLTQAPVHEDEDVQEEWLDYIAEHPLPDVLNFYDYDHISNVFNGKARSRVEDPEDEKPKRRRDAEDEVAERPSRSRSRNEDEEPEEKPSTARKRDEPEPWAEEPDEKPRGRVRSRDPEPEAEDEPEEKPRRSHAQPEPDPAPEDDEPEEKPRRARSRGAEVADSGPKPGGIRERLAARRSASKRDDD